MEEQKKLLELLDESFAQEVLSEKEDEINICEEKETEKKDEEKSLQSTEENLNLKSELMTAQETIIQLANKLQNYEKMLTKESQSETEKILEEPLVPPELNLDEFDGMEDQKKEEIVKNYREKISEYTKKSVMKEISPMIKEYQEGLKFVETEKAKESLKHFSQFPDFSEKLPKIEKLVEKIPNAENLNPTDLYTMGYFMAKGIEICGEKKSIEEQINEISKNSELMKALEKKRLLRYSEKDSLPIIRGSNGLSNAKVNLPEKPKTLEEAYRLSLASTI